MISNMFGLGGDSKAILQAIEKSQAMVEFDPNGKVLKSNKLFCDLLGYDLNDVTGRHHSSFLQKDYAQSADYKELWTKIQRNESDVREYVFTAKSGEEIWVHAVHIPVINAHGALQKVVELATDVTALRVKAADDAARLDVISRNQNVLEFTPDGQILWANEVFLNALGYRLEELEGRQLSMLLDPAYVQSAAYHELKSKLALGEPAGSTISYYGKGGKQNVFRISYCPVLHTSGKVNKILALAFDVTANVTAIEAIAAGLQYFAKGELYHQIKTPFDVSIDGLRVNYNSAIDVLCKAMWQVGGSVMAIESGTLEIRSSADDLSRRTEQQAASLEETAAALDQITATVRKTAEGAKHACEVVSGAKTSAVHSGDVVRRAVEAMNNIEKSSSQISQIIGVIDEIAFQTNLLALNAGVEAARAGEAGRGFAVVASEVRALAQRSAEAAKEIKALIHASTSQVEEGVSFVGETGKALARIVEQVIEINDIVVNITASAQEESTALAEVNSAINQMDQMTQQNAAMVEESAAATHALLNEIAKLSEMVGTFKVSDKNGMAKKKTAEAPAKTASHAPAAKPVTAMKTVGRGGAALKPKADAQDWEEF